MFTGLFWNDEGEGPNYDDFTVNRVLASQRDRWRDAEASPANVYGMEDTRPFQNEFGRQDAQLRGGPMSPMTHAPENMVNQPPPPAVAQPQQGGGFMRDFLGAFADPAVQAGLGQSINNIMRMRRGGMPGPSPMQAYQQAVVTQANLKQREAQNRRAQETHERNMDPFWEFEEAKRRGHIPETMSYQDWLRTGGRAGASSKAFAPKIGTDADGNKVMLMPKYDPSTGAFTIEQQALPPGWTEDSSITEVDAGGEIHLYDKTGRYLGVKPKTLAPEKTQDYIQEVEDIKQWAPINANFEMRASQSLPQMQQAISTMEQMVGIIDANPGVSQGLIEGYWGGSIDQVAGALEALATTLAVPILADAKLQPVTEQEFRAIRSTVMNPNADPEVNRKILKAQIAWLKPRLKILQDELDYYKENGTMKGYVMELPDTPLPTLSSIGVKTAQDEVDF